MKKQKCYLIFKSPGDFWDTLYKMGKKKNVRNTKKKHWYKMQKYNTSCKKPPKETEASLWWLTAAATTGRAWWWGIPAGTGSSSWWLTAVIVFYFSRFSILSGSGGHNMSLWNLCHPCVKRGHRRKIQNTQELVLCVEARRWWSCLTLDQSKIPGGLSIAGFLNAVSPSQSAQVLRLIAGFCNADLPHMCTLMA